MKATKAQLIEAVMMAVPYASQITALDLDGEQEAIRFTWRGDRFRVSEGLSETVEGDMLCGGNLAILMQTVITRGLLVAMDRAGQKEARQEVSARRVS